MLIAVSGVAAIGTFFYAVTAARGIAPRPRGPEGKRIELAVTLATVIEFAAAIVLPVIVSAAGHSDWVLPSIAITIGPLLLWLDHRVHVPRYRPVGWRDRGPVILVATMSGTPSSPPRASPPGCYCSSTAVAGFHDLAEVRRAEQARVETAALSVSAGAQLVRGSAAGGVRRGAGRRALAVRLSRARCPVRMLSRHQPSAPLEGVDWRPLTPPTPKPRPIRPKAHPSPTDA